VFVKSRVRFFYKLFRGCFNTQNTPCTWLRPWAYDTL